MQPQGSSTLNVHLADSDLDNSSDSQQSTVRPPRNVIQTSRFDGKRIDRTVFEKARINSFIPGLEVLRNNIQYQEAYNQM